MNFKKLKQKRIGNWKHESLTNIKDQEIHKFLIIFEEILRQIKRKEQMEIDIEEEGDSTDGIRDTIKVVSIEIYKFLQQDIDSLDLPEIIKNCL